MEYWEFLIQREGDLSWREIKTGNLQLKEGKYRVVVKSNLLNTEITTRIVRQTLGSRTPQRRSKSQTQVTSVKGLLMVIPFTQLESGIWQFVCSGVSADRTAWHKILKLRVLPRTQDRSSVAPVIDRIDFDAETILSRANIFDISKVYSTVDESEDIAPPTEPLIPISTISDRDNWQEHVNLPRETPLERIWEQIETPRVTSPGSSIGTTGSNVIQFGEIADPPLQLINLDRSTFSGVIPGNRITVSGACNLKLFSANLVQTVKIEKLSICLRHPQTAEIAIAIEKLLPPQLDAFAFTSQLELPTEPKATLLLGEVKLYDRHNIQLGSGGFTIALDLSPIDRHRDVEPLLELFDSPPAKVGERRRDRIEVPIDRFTQELQQETFAPQLSVPASRHVPLSSPTQYPTTPLTYKRDAGFSHPDIMPISRSSAIQQDTHRDGTAARENRAAIDEIESPTEQPRSRSTPADISSDLDLDFHHPALFGIVAVTEYQTHYHQNFDNLEVVVDD
jgi:hypothetical protein